MPAFDHRSGASLPVGSARIHHEDTGPQDGEPWVFLHGGFGTIETFNALRAGLSADLRCIGIDSRGHGASTMGRSAPDWHT